jgi:hypothetical protein
LNEQAAPAGSVDSRRTDCIDIGQGECGEGGAKDVRLTLSLTRASR